MHVSEQEKEQIFKRYQDGDVDINSPEFKLFVAKIHEFNPLSFARAFLNDHLKDQGTGNLVASPPFHTELIDLFRDHNRIAVAAPRGHAKSTITSFIYVLHQALYGKKKNIVIISASEDMATRFLRRLRDELEFNPLLNWLFGTQKSDKWSETEIRLANRCVIHAKGRGAQLRGLIDGNRRPDLIVLDDIEDEELVRSELRRLDLEQWFNGTVLPTLEPSIGKLILIGTILHQDSLLARVLDPELYPDFEQRKYSAVIETPEGEETTLWPERFSHASLKKLKESYMARQQLAQFYMEYMNDPMPQESAAFHPEYFQSFNELPPATDQAWFEIYIDLGGGSAKVTADFTAIVCVAIDKHNNIFVHDYLNVRYGADTNKFLEDLFQMNAKHNPHRIVIEKTVAANLIKANLEAEQLKRRVFLNVEYVVPPRGTGDRRGNMSDAKFQRITALASPFKLGVIKIRPWMTELQEQLLAFPRAKHDDLADALGYAFMHVQRRFHKRVKDPILDKEKPQEYEMMYPELGI